MKRVAVFGNAGGGKSTLSKRLAQTTGLPLVALDLVQYKPGGEKVPDEEYKTAHAKILQQERWIIDGFGSLDTVWKRLEAADTLVYVSIQRKKFVMSERNRGRQAKRNQERRS